MLLPARTLISQYAPSPTIAALVDFINQHLDPRTNLDEFFARVWNIQTAKGFGLDIWGEIVGVKRTVNVVDGLPYLGFSEAAAGARPFDEAPFYGGWSLDAANLTMADPAYRTAILVKALANISASTAPTINALLSQLFVARGKCFVTDLGGMAIEYNFEFELSNYEFAILTQSGIILRPAGVTVTLIAAGWPPTVIS